MTPKDLIQKILPLRESYPLEGGMEDTQNEVAYFIQSWAGLSARGSRQHREVMTTFMRFPWPSMAKLLSWEGSFLLSVH